MLVAKAADTVASSALVAKLLPSPIIVLMLVIAAALTDVRTDTFATTVLILVIASRFVFVSADTEATSVTVAAETPAISNSSESILVALRVPKTAEPVATNAVLTETVPKF